MATRRSFIKTLAALPAAMALEPAWSMASDPSRLALIIGNSAYRGAPLLNPANDAKAVSTLLGQAGFAVDSLTNASRTDMLAAIDRFGIAAKRPEVKLVVFYYAGHGAQLDWRNYLLPVDAMVENQEQMRQRCIDLNVMLGQLSAAKDKAFVVILDACRNNPFGQAYRPQQKGLSQFDAPVGSLIAYATAPGNVASDGAGENGLYTGNLLRELSQRGTRLEDALKRVRLNVRLASGGEQIPWETTSLENDVILFGDGKGRLSEAELEKLVEADIAEWTRIKASTKSEDWVAYLRNFPNGRFAEIAQVRLARLLSEREKPFAGVHKMPATEENKLVEGAKPGIDIRAGEVSPILPTASDNPFSAGRFPLRRTYTVGDAVVMRQTDLDSGVEQNIRTLKVSSVSVADDRVEFNQGVVVTDLMGNVIKNVDVEFDTPIQFTPAEFQLGKKWTAVFRRNKAGDVSAVNYDVHIVRKETITVPAGTFSCFLIEAKGWNTTKNISLHTRLWMVPEINYYIRREVRNTTGRGRPIISERHELVALRQHVRHAA